MGLCKCPKRKVTSLFCREHNVNVCEHCMAESHKQCVIKSFSDWLSDSDAESNCLLCNHPLRDAECVRLQCLDIYHTSCLAEYGFSHPAHTAPAGYRCPTCKTGIIPEPNSSSIIVSKLREFLTQVNWARPALGLAPLPKFDRSTIAPVHVEQSIPAPTAVYEVPPIAKHNHVQLDMGSGNAQFDNIVRHQAPAPTPKMYPVPSPPSMADTLITARRKQELDMEPLLSRNEDENKYERRTNIRSSGMRCSSKRKLIYIVGGLFTLLFLLMLMHNNKDSDPLLNPQMDPNMAQVAPES